MEFLENLPFSSIIGALEYQSQVKPTNQAILYPDSTKNSTEYASLTYQQFNNLTNHLAEKISEYLPKISSNESITCALLSIGGLEYLLSQYALLKLPHVIMFPLSARNSSAAIEHLLKETKTYLLLTTTLYLPMIKTIQENNQQLQSMKIILLDQDEFLVENLLKNKDIQSSFSSKIIKNNEELSRIVVILHSSGSTSHPRPIYLSNRYFLISYSSYQSLNKDFWKEDDVALTWGALFHLLAFNGTVRAILAGCTYALPLCVTFPLKPDELVNNIQAPNGITVLVTVPSLLEQLIRELLSEKNQHIGLKPLQKLKFVMYGGAGCPDHLCQTLIDNNVVLLSVYGSTETGLVLVNNFHPYDKRWKFMQLPLSRKPYVRIETPVGAQNPNEKIIIHLPTDPFLAHNISNQSDGSYMVGDILLEDPPNSGFYRILGRQDDTLVHITGEKTNPIPIEHTIQSCPLVKQIVVVGHNQFCTAALVELDKDKTKSLEKKEILDEIWKYVEQANKDAPTHSRLTKQLIHILSNDESLPVTHKGNLQRPKINQLYSNLISQIYDEFLNEQYKEQQQEKIVQRSIWTKESIEKYLQEKFQEIVGHTIDVSKSVFDFGVNSLQIVELRNLICEEICHIPKNFLYENSSIDQMSEKLFEFIQSGSKENENNDSSSFHYQSAEQILDKYRTLIETNFPSLSKEENQKTQRTFLLTGANGSLGCFILRDLLSQSSTTIKRIYCLLRGSNPEQRLFESFQQRKLDSSLLNDQRLVILSSSMNLSEEYLGQSNEIYEELKEELTDIIHSAWKMNFNQTVKDFEFDSILGVYHLLKLSSFNQCQFHFISSISSASSGLLQIIKEKPLPEQIEIALPQGYGQSKFISEHLCWKAKQISNIQIKIYRVGQISGDTLNGIWNSTEMAAMMIYAGAGQLHKMPNVGNDINWIPVDICSQTLVELALKSSKDQHVYHLMNPNCVEYQNYLNLLRESGLRFDIVSKDKFLDAILTTTDQTNPLIKLSSFLEQIYRKKENSKPSTTFQTEKTVEHSQTLKNCPRIDSHLIQLYVNYWTNSKILKENS